VKLRSFALLILVVAILCPALAAQEEPAKLVVIHWTQDAYKQVIPFLPYGHDFKVREVVQVMVAGGPANATAYIVWLTYKDTDGRVLTDCEFAPRRNGGIQAGFYRDGIKIISVTADPIIHSSAGPPVTSKPE
jgi:hypothetical protein